MNQSVLTMESPPDLMQSPKQVAIVEAATKLFLSQGFGAVSVDAIAAEAQVSKRTVYSHFENKEALFAGVMYDICERSGGQAGCPMFNEDLVRHMPLREILQKTGEHVLGIIVSPTAVKLFRVVMGEAGRFPELGRRFYEFGPGSMKDALVGYFEQKTSAGELDIDNPDQAACYYCSLVMEPLKMELLCGVRDSVSPEEVSEAVADAVEVFLKIYSPRSA